MSLYGQFSGSGGLFLVALPDDLLGNVAAKCAEGAHGHLMPLRLACRRLRDAARGLKVYNEGMRLCNIAAGAGHLELLKWARGNGCPMDKNTLS